MIPEQRLHPTCFADFVDNFVKLWGKRSPFPLVTRNQSTLIGVQIFLSNYHRGRSRLAQSIDLPSSHLPEKRNNLFPGGAIGNPPTPNRESRVPWSSEIILSWLTISFHYKFQPNLLYYPYHWRNVWSPINREKSEMNHSHEYNTSFH